MPRRIRLTREGDGEYGYKHWRIQNPHKMYPPDPDKQWYLHSPFEGVYGPFDTLREVREFLAEHEEDTDA